MFQVVVGNKGDGIYAPIEGRTIFASTEDVKIYMAARAMYPIVWSETGCHEYPLTGSDDRPTGFRYMVVRLNVFPGKVGA